MGDLFGDGARPLELRSECEGKNVKLSHRRRSSLEEIADESVEWRRAFGAAELIRLMGAGRLKDGVSYHILTGGNIDMLSNVKWMRLVYGKVRKLYIACWVIGGIDILLLERMVRDGDVGEVVLMVGDNYRNNYKQEWKKLMDLYDRRVFGQVFEGNIHCKVLLGEMVGGEKVVVEGSMNCNTNNRWEQEVVSTHEGLYGFYEEFFRDFREQDMVRKTNLRIHGLDFDV